MWWYILAGVLFILVIVVTYRVGFIKGYRVGALKVLGEWKEVMKTEEDK